MKKKTNKKGGFIPLFMEKKQQKRLEDDLLCMDIFPILRPYFAYGKKYDIKNIK